MVYVSEMNVVGDYEELMSPASLLWGFSEPLRGIYVIVKHLNIPFILQPHAIAFLFAISWAQVIALPCQGVVDVTEAVRSVCFMAAIGR